MISNERLFVDRDVAAKRTRLHATSGGAMSDPAILFGMFVDDAGSVESVFKVIERGDAGREWLVQHPAGLDFVIAGQWIPHRLQFVEHALMADHHRTWLYTSIDACVDDYNAWMRRRDDDRR